MPPKHLHETEEEYEQRLRQPTDGQLSFLEQGEDDENPEDSVPEMRRE